MSTLKFYITTPIYYTNAPPHIGSAYTTVIGDILARYYSSLGYDTFYLTGTDEHGTKIARIAKASGKTPKEFVDAMVEEFKKAWDALDIKYSNFIRTTDPTHEETVKLIINRIYENGDIYKDIYRGLYCVDCERYYTQKELLEGGLCPFHKKPVEYMEIESYFFRLSKYQGKLLELLQNTDFCPFRKEEVINRVKEGLLDVSISRPRSQLEWGIPLPFDDSHVLYVWFDALLNYISGVGYLSSPETFKKFWPADVHLVGKDILWFHSVIWPAMLMSAGFELPKKVVTHGFLTVNGQKISKSLGTAIDPVALVEKYGSDAIRYYLAMAISFGEDGDFSENLLKERINCELADCLGNLVRRVTVLLNKFYNSVLPSPEKDTVAEQKLKDDINKLLEVAKNEFAALRIHAAVCNIWQSIARLNAYLNETEPWKISDSGRKATVLYTLINGVAIITAWIAPVIPKTAKRIASYLGFQEVPAIKDVNWNMVPPGRNVKVSDILFAKI